MLEQASGGLGQNGAAPRALQQPGTQVRLELAHLPAERGLRQVEHLRRLAEAAELGDADDGFQPEPVHRGAIAARALDRARRR